MSWFTAVSWLGAPRWIWALIALALAVAGALVAYTSLVDKQDDIAKDNREVGAAVQREQDLQETVTRVEKANDVRNEVEAEAAVGHGDRLYQQCLRSASPATRSNCERLLPN